MSTELRVRGASEEQRDEIAKQLEARGIGGWESVGEPRAIIGEGEDAEYGPQTFGFSIPAEGQTDIASLAGWLEKQGIAHALEQVQPSTGPRASSAEEPAPDDDEDEPASAEEPAEEPASTGGKHAADDTKEQDA
jgi:hypothetical protein